MALSRVHVWSAGEILLASDLNAEFNNPLTNTNSMISPFTATVSAGAFSITNVGAAAARIDVPQYAQVQNSASSIINSVSGTNTVTGTLTPTLTAYTSGQIFTLNPANTNTGATTLNIDGLGAKSIFSGGTACAGRELTASIPVQVEYDGTQFNILSSTQSSTWTPVDGSGATLSLVNTTQAVYMRSGPLVLAEFDIAYPVTADGSNALIGGLPFAARATSVGLGAIVSFQNVAAGFAMRVVAGAATFNMTVSGTVQTNANMSGKTVRGVVVYFA